MSNEQLVMEIQKGETRHYETLWEQVKLFAYKRAWSFFGKHADRLKSLGVELDDLKQEAYLALYGAVEGFRADRGAGFLTYADFHIKKSFHAAARFHRGATRNYSETSLEFEHGGETYSLLDTLADETAESGFENVLDREYLSKAAPVLEKALGRLTECQRETALACIGGGLPYAEYAKRMGLTRATAQQAGHRALKNLRANPELAACAV